MGNFRSSEMIYFVRPTRTSCESRASRGLLGPWHFFVSELNILCTGVWTANFVERSGVL
jgi:hypothetical protein